MPPKSCSGGTLRSALWLPWDRRVSEEVEAGVKSTGEGWKTEGSWREWRTWELKKRSESKEKRNEEEEEGRHLHYFWSLKLVLDSMS